MILDLLPALTMAASLLLEALSARFAASGGVRWPSQVEIRKDRALAPNSWAWAVDFKNGALENG